MNEQAIEDIKNSLREMMQLLVQRGEPLSEELKTKIAQVMEHAATRITQLREEGQQQPEQPPEQPPHPPQVEPNLGAPPSPGAQLMWILAGQKDDAFVNYLRTYPDPELQALLRNPEELQRTINFLNQMMPQGEQPEQGGIPHADLNSSNIYGFKYDPKSKKLLVRFQGGSVYGYNGVPPGVFRVFQNGAVPARTDGQNNYGRWWRGKQPSLGAAFYQMIRQGGYPYQRLS
jgi:hypothetical protein